MKSKITVQKLKIVIQTAIQKSNPALFKAIKIVYSFQTSEEQFADNTYFHNGQGFTAFDAEILSSFARQIINWETGLSKFRQPLSKKQLEIARKKMIKYWKQLMPMARIKLEA